MSAQHARIRTLPGVLTGGVQDGPANCVNSVDVGSAPDQQRGALVSTNGTLDSVQWRLTLMVAARAHGAGRPAAIEGLPVCKLAGVAERLDRMFTPVAHVHTGAMIEQPRHH